jgi:riboflavin-specific deaminase-like protein
MQTGLPFVRVKMAMSLDGRTAMASGESLWITGEAARQDVQRLRAQSCAIITAGSTVLSDDAQLTVRDEQYLDALGARRPLRVLLDQHAHVGLDARIFNDQAPTLWCTSKSRAIASACRMYSIGRCLPNNIAPICEPCSQNSATVVVAMCWWKRVPHWQALSCRKSWWMKW